MAEHYFLIVFDDETEEWSLDYDTLVARFPEGSVWADEEDDYPAEWLRFEELGETEKNNARAISNDLQRKIAEWNNVEETM